MAITYSNFLTQVRNYTEVSSTVLSDTLIDQFIRNVELDIAGKVDYDDLRKYSTSNFTASNRYVSLPSDCMILRSIESIVQTNATTTTRTFLEKRDTSFISEFNNDGATGSPKYFANWDDFNIAVAPEPSTSNVVQTNYIKNPPHFDSSTNTFLSTYQESMLLHLSLIHISEPTRPY